MQLPKPLQPWAATLDLFPAELAGALGPLVLRLDRLIGPPRFPDVTHTGEPDGFDGLTRLGPYERLLLSDWLMLSENPDEFVRRAAMGEHAFYRLQHKVPAGGRVSVALFDAGPDVWGTPRLALLAALVVLHRRAEAAGMRFLWGNAQTVLAATELPTPLQDLAPAALYEAVTPETVREWLGGRSAALVDGDGWNRCRRYIAQAVEAENPVTDLWLVGGPCVTGLPEARDVFRLTVEDDYTPDARRLRVSLRQPRGKLGTGLTDAVLELPDDPACVRLLRDPFSAARVTPRRNAPGKFAPASELVLDPSGVKLYARSSDGQILAYPIPNSPNAASQPPKQYRSAYLKTVQAVGRVRRALLLFTLTADGTALRMEQPGRGLPSREFPYLNNKGNVPDDVALGTCVYSEVDGACFILLPNGDLLRLRLTETSLTVVDTDIVAVAVSNKVAYVRRTASHLQVLPFASPVPRRGGAGRAFFGTGKDGGPARVALEVGAERWSVSAIDWHKRELYPATEITPPPGARVVGVATEWENGWTPKDTWKLVAIEPNGRTISYCDDTGHYPIVTADAPVVHATVAQEGPPLVAYSTEAGEVAVYSLSLNTHLYRLQPEKDARSGLNLLANPEDHFD